MAEYLKLLGYIFLAYICIYGLVSRVCKCVEHHTEWKYRTRVDAEWPNSQLNEKADTKEGNSDV